jgi:hypothetical protein
MTGMTNATEPGTANLTGVWHGLYTYAHRSESVSFVATLIESGSSLSGATHEPCVGDDCPCDTLYATLLGTRQARAIAFVKTYEAAGPHYRDPVAYEGTLSADGTEIGGMWNIQRVWFGKFLMIRSSGHAATVSRKAFEHV